MRGHHVCRFQLAHASQPLQGRTAFGFTLTHQRRCGPPFGLALAQLILGRLHSNVDPLEICLGLTRLGAQGGLIHFSEHRAGLDEIALPDRNHPKPSWQLGRDIDLHRLDPAIASGHAGRQPIAAQ